MIKPTQDSKWFRYDDERVTPVTIDEVLEQNFGSDEILTNGVQTRLSRVAAQWKKYTSAYMLVYLRETAIDEILAPITDADVPDHVIRKVEADREEAARIKREKEEMHLYMNIRMINVATFRNHDGVDLASFDVADDGSEQFVKLFRVRRDLTWLAFYQEIAKKNGVPRDHIRLWHLVNRQNKTVRPDVPIPADPQQSTHPRPQCQC
jgi:ubiquitin carboxyl-terminal hydrolase 7